MKKMIILLLTAVLVLSMVGCKKKAEYDAEPTEFPRDESSQVVLQPDA